MTTTFSTDRCPIPTDDEITFPALRREAFLVLTGTPTSTEATNAVVHAVAPGLIRVAAVGPGFHTMDGMAQVRAALLPVIQQESPDLLDDEWLASGKLTDGPYRAGRVGLGYLAEAVTFAVTRRISRESHQAALIIDRAARTLLTVRRRCPTFATGMTLFVPDLHGWDRPSLRCLYRFVLLAEPADRVSVVALAAPAKASPMSDSPADRIGPARTAFFERMAATGVVRVVPAPEPPTPQTSPATGVDDIPREYADLLLAMGDALVFQNYERVYHLARYALDRADDAEQEAQARRLIAIADAQLDEFARAAENLERAATLTDDLGFAAHLHYLQGLIATKRHYDLDTAAALYSRGLAVLDRDTGEEPVERRVERAWIYNGQALVMALRAKAVTDSLERERLLAAAFDLELRAFALVRGASGAAPAYLRHNLMANLTFLLEISRRFDDAVRFWSRAFEAYLASDSREFRVAFDARLGLLTLKAGRPEEGLTLLEKARTVCRETADRFGEGELCLKLGYAYSAYGDHESAYRAYLDGLRIGHSMREADICADALTGMLWSLAELGGRESLDRLRESVLRALPRTALAERLRTMPAGSRTEPIAALTAAGMTRPVPSPKLRAYIPAVDLEGTPTQDLNRYLVWGENALPQRGSGTDRGQA